MGTGPMNEYTESLLISKQPENHHIVSFEIKPIPSMLAKRRAGQYLLLKLKEAGGWSESHPFTITSRLNDDHLKITVKKIGDFTTRLHAIEPPVPVMIQGPLGSFAGGIDAHREIVFIAGGIGVTPFISLLDYLQDRRTDVPITLFWANENMSDMFGLDRFKAWTAVLNLTIIMVVNHLQETVSLNADGFSWESGYITRDLFARYVRGQGQSIYMCGSPGMQKYIFDQLKALGVVPEMVETEKFGIYMADKQDAGGR